MDNNALFINYPRKPCLFDHSKISLYIENSDILGNFGNKEFKVNAI